jgi:hypothetical protein
MGRQFDTSSARPFLRIGITFESFHSHRSLHEEFCWYFVSSGRFVFIESNENKVPSGVSEYETLGIEKENIWLSSEGLKRELKYLFRKFATSDGLLPEYVAPSG